MPTAAMRPTFLMEVALPAEQAMDRLEAGMARAGRPVVVQRAGLHMTVTVDRGLRHFWSPWMNLEFDQPADASATGVHARFSPAPSLWTGFMMIYLTLTAAAFFATMFAAAQWMMGSPPTLLWGTLAGVLGCGAMWWISRVGQRLAHDQMVLLREILEKELGDDSHVSSDEAVD